MTNDIREFCNTFGACHEGKDWAIANCTDMADAWQKLKPEWLLWAATREGVLDDCTLRLFACWSVRQVWYLLTDERSRNAVDVAERFAHGEATSKELAATRDAAWAAASDAASDAAWDAARDSAWDAARAAASDAAWDAAMAAQIAWLRASVPNPFAAVEKP